jgi:hypothetical protein
MVKLLTPSITAYESIYLTEKNTGLGNTLFQVASVWGLAKTTGRNFSSYRLKLYCNRLKERFNFDHGDTFYQSFLSNTDYTTEPTQYIPDTGGKRYDPNIIPAILGSSTDCIQIDNFLESPLYFHQYRNELLQLLQYDSVREIMKLKMPSIFQHNITPISVHIRNAHDSVKFNFVYYEYAVSLFNLHQKNPYYFIFIDDPLSMPFNPTSIGMKDFEYVHSDTDYIDLYLMSFCQHHISSISTFAWWGSYLCQNPNKIITISRSAAEFMKQANNLTEEMLINEYYMSNIRILPS